MPVRKGPIAVWGDQVQVVLCWWWLVAALVEVGVAAVVDSAFQVVHVQRELLPPLALAVPVLSLLLVGLVDVLAWVGAVVTDHRFVRQTCTACLKSVFNCSLFSSGKRKPIVSRISAPSCRSTVVPVVELVVKIAAVAETLALVPTHPVAD